MENDKKNDKKGKGGFMAKPIEATPVLKGQDLIDFVNSLNKSDTKESQAKRRAALRLLKKVRK